MKLKNYFKALIAGAWIWAFILGLVLDFLIAFVLMLLLNFVVPVFYEPFVITYWESFGLVLLLNIIKSFFKD